MKSRNNNGEVASVMPDFNFYLVITAPFIYSLIFPIVLLHVFVEVYQRISFPIYKIDLVEFNHFFNTDRVKICNLTFIQKVHCLYCDYANGCLAYAVEIAARTENFWCPIKHENERKNTHNHYDDFLNI